LTDILATLQRRSKTVILAFTATVLVAVAALESADLWWRREQTMTAAERRAGNLAFVVSDYVRGTFSLADTALRQLALHAQRAGGPSAVAAEWDLILTAARSALTGSGSITVTDAEGKILYSTQPAIVGQSRRDNYIFKRLVSSEADEPVIGTPYLSVVEPRRYVIPIGRRLATRDGKFDGTVVATLMPEGYREFFRTIEVGTEGIIWVFHPDGVLLFREPTETGHTGESAIDNPLLQTAQRVGGNGVTVARLQQAGPQFVSAFRTLGTPPLTIAVSLSETDVLADWRHQRRTSALAFAALTLTIAAMLSVLFRQMSARALVEKELADVQRLEAARLREANERLEEALQREQKARQDVQAASYLKDEFLMTVSHELRTPLTAVYGWVRMLGINSGQSAEKDRALAAIDRNVRTQTRLIDDLLDVSSAISGKLRLEARGVKIADVVLAAVDPLDPALQAKSITLERIIEPGIEPILADPDRLQQIVWNLLSNAMKFTPEGGTIRLNVSKKHSQIEIAVSDSGVGIPPEFLPHVFERFRQAEAGSRRRFGGLGLGLAIVRHLVELHGGTVSAASEGEGRGSTFKVTIPIRYVRADVPAQTPGDAASAATLKPL
jgi:signal transduction histidine kinase